MLLGLDQFGHVALELSSALFGGRRNSAAAASIPSLGLSASCDEAREPFGAGHVLASRDEALLHVKS